ncbi:hypothetical protein PoB_007281800 [Plakobranchus ocellatus]|uniref:Uncharacterized protein n=1 Tax=Plakobranchus ocellatus TaxID=259542 RepID=A0AAV4DQI0_9GAST|nr:hypothetical protein PoB_007281800 [Plakobranchus ocellatus]
MLLVHKKVISGLHAIRQARAPGAALEAATDGSLQTPGRVLYQLCHQQPALSAFTHTPPLNLQKDECGSAAERKLKCRVVKSTNWLFGSNKSKNCDGIKLYSMRGMIRVAKGWEMISIK